MRIKFRNHVASYDVWRLHGTILEVSSAKIGSYLACMHGFIYDYDYD